MKSGSPVVLRVCEKKGSAFVHAAPLSLIHGYRKPTIQELVEIRLIAADVLVIRVSARLRSTIWNPRGFDDPDE